MTYQMQIGFQGIIADVFLFLEPSEGRLELDDRLSRSQKGLLIRAPARDQTVAQVDVLAAFRDSAGVELVR